MDVKIQLTKHFAKEEQLVVDTSKLLNNLYRSWWQNTRKNGERSFALTERGYTIISKHLKFYNIDLPDDLYISNNTVVWLDKFIDCPYFLTRDTIFVSREKVAVQLILFSGDLNRFGKAKDTSLKNHAKSA